MIENYNIQLVFLSIGMAFLASYTAVDLALRMNSATGRARKFWHVGGSIAMGLGVWGMHFIGMLAFKLPVSVTYDIFLTFISFLPSALASMVVLWVMSRSDTRWPVLLLSSVVMGVGISSMHYVGMLAMQIVPSVKYDSLWFILSFVVAIVLSFVTLSIISRFDLNTYRLKNTGVKLLCAMSMATAISGMHYTGMAATIFPSEIVPVEGLFGFGGDWLATLVGLGVVMILLSSSVAAIVDSRFADQNMQMVNKLKELNRKLIAHANSSNQAVIEKESAMEAVKLANVELVNAKELAERSSVELAGYLEAIDQHALVSVTDIRGRIVRVNEKFIQVSGYSREELLNQDHRIINSGTHPKKFFVEMWCTISRGDIWRNEICNRAKDGSLYWIDTAIVPLKDDHGKIVRYISVRVDVTKHKNVEEKLRHAMGAVETAAEAKSRFLANMSHEIRTPMNSILGMTRLLMQTKVDDRQLDYASNILRSSQHLLTIINDVLDLSKIEAGKIKLIVQDFDLQEILDDVSSQFSHQLNDKEITLGFDISLDISQSFHGDSLRLSQILLNYVSNAFKFTEKGKITIGVQILEKDELGCLVKFDVKDTGIGISKDQIDHLFQSFSQVDTSTTRKYGGTGLGLAVSKELAELMGGSVGVESELGKGSVFWFTARLGQGGKVMNKKPAQQLPQDTDQLKAFCILVVEDNELNQRVAKEFLEYNGATVEIASNGKEAIDMLRDNEGRFDCVLMDVQMPVMDGVEATRQIRLDTKLCNTLVIAMTANVDAKDRKLCSDVDMDDFIAKPIDPDLLVSTLLKWLRPETVSDDSSCSFVATDVSTPQNTNTLIDPSVLAVSLGRNDPIQMHKYFVLFVESTKESMREMEIALNNADLTTVAALGHRVKSAAQTVGATSFAEYCKELESFKDGGEIVCAREIFQQMQLLLESIEKQLESNLI